MDSEFGPAGNQAVPVQLVVHHRCHILLHPRTGPAWVSRVVHIQRPRYLVSPETSRDKTKNAVPCRRATHNAGHQRRQSLRMIKFRVTRGRSSGENVENRRANSRTRKRYERIHILIVSLEQGLRSPEEVIDGYELEDSGQCLNFHKPRTQNGVVGSWEDTERAYGDGKKRRKRIRVAHKLESPQPFCTHGRERAAIRLHIDVLIPIVHTFWSGGNEPMHKLSSRLPYQQWRQRVITRRNTRRVRFFGREQPQLRSEKTNERPALAVQILHITAPGLKGVDVAIHEDSTREERVEKMA